MATMEYKGYVARIDVDEDNDGFHGRVINISDVVNFKGRSIRRSWTGSSPVATP